MYVLFLALCRMNSVSILHVQVEQTKHFLLVKNRRDNPLTSPSDNSPDQLKYALRTIDPSKTLDVRQQCLVRRRASMMIPPPPILSKLSVPEIEVMKSFQHERFSHIALSH